jgi:hypothetical protein
VCASFFTKQRGSIPESGRISKESGGKKRFPAGFEAFLRGQVGGVKVFEQADKNCVGKQPPKKRRFFHSNAGFGVVFEVFSGKMQEG